jgi:hypothetical protein
MKDQSCHIITLHVGSQIKETHHLVQKQIFKQRLKIITVLYWVKQIYELVRKRLYYDI